MANNSFRQHEITRLLTVEEAAAALHAMVTIAAVRAAIRDKRLRATKIGRRYFVAIPDLERFARCRDRANPPASGKEGQANGSFSMPVPSTGQAIAEKAADDLLKTLSGTTSHGGHQSAPARRSLVR